MFSICAFLSKPLHGLYNFSLKCARRLSETQRLPSYPLQEPHLQHVESPLLPVKDATIICKSLCLSAFSEWSIVTPKEERGKQLPLMKANEKGLRDSLIVLGMFRRRMLVLCQSGTRNSLSKKDAFALIPASVERVQSAAQHSSLCGGDGFRRDGL